jgi:class 3 adenylate cyclase
MSRIELDIEALTAAGLYDAAAPDAAERLELIEFLLEQDCTVDEMLAADSRGRLFALAGDRIVRPGRDIFTLDEIAEQIGCPVEEVRAVWRALGLVVADADLPVASVADIDMVRTAIGMTAVLGREATLGLARVMGSSMARVGDAASTSVRSQMPSMSVAVSGSELETARAFAGIAGAVPALGRVLDTLFRHHLENARMHFERTDSWDVIGAGGIRVGVGFTDLCGFTGLTQQLSMDHLSQLLSRFEEIATDVVNDHGGRLVKFIGDAVMFVAADAPTAVTIADALVEAARERGLTARGGVTVGTALALDGDYFGPIVNLAARLVALADPGTVLVSAEVAERVQGTRVSIPLGPQQIRGFDDPVSVCRLQPVG